MQGDSLCVTALVPCPRGPCIASVPVSQRLLLLLACVDDCHTSVNLGSFTKIILDVVLVTVLLLRKDTMTKQFFFLKLDLLKKNPNSHSLPFFIFLFLQLLFKKKKEHLMGVHL